MMKFTGRVLVFMTLLAILLLPLQAAHAHGMDKALMEGRVIFGSSYTLKDGESISGGLVIIGGSALLESGSTLYGDLVVIGGSSTIQQGASISGAVVTIGGSLTVDTEVMGDVIIIGGPAQLQENARVRGNLVTIGGPVQKAEGARVDGEIIDNPTPPERPNVDVPLPIVPNTPNIDVSFNPLWEAFWLLARSFGYGLLAMLIVLFLPQQTRRVSDAVVRQPLNMGGIGLLSYILFVVVLVALALFSILIITLLLTVPLIVVVGLVMGAAMAFGWIALGTEVGSRIIGMFNLDWPLPVSAGLGTFIMTLVADGIGFIPCVGWIAPVILTMLGVGAVAMTRFGTQPATFIVTPAEAEYVPPAEMP